jgi:hypothetical protein
MRRAVEMLGAVALFALCLARPVLGAGEIVVTASPAETQVGQRVEVLVRTFVPVPAASHDFPSPRPEYPAASGLWEMLYPWDDYPFDVRAELPGQTVRIPLTRDLHDSTLWRGFWTPTRAGAWTVRSYNFVEGHPGASTTVRVIDAPLGAADVGATAGVGLMGLAVGVVLGPVVARFSRTRPAPTAT